MIAFSSCTLGLSFKANNGINWGRWKTSKGFQHLPEFLLSVPLKPWLPPHQENSYPCPTAFGSNLLWTPDLKVDKGRWALIVAIPVTLAVAFLLVTAFSFFGAETWDRVGESEKEEGFSPLTLAPLFAFTALPSLLFSILLVYKSESHLGKYFCFLVFDLPKQFPQPHCQLLYSRKSETWILKNLYISWLNIRCFWSLVIFDNYWIPGLS